MRPLYVAGNQRVLRFPARIKNGVETNACARTYEDTRLLSERTFEEDLLRSVFEFFNEINCGNYAYQLALRIPYGKVFSVPDKRLICLMKFVKCVNKKIQKGKN